MKEQWNLRRSYDSFGLGPEVTLEVTRGRTRSHIREIDVAAYLIGSAEDCDLVLADPQFPEVHAYIVRHNEGVSLRYLGNKPALTVNRRLVRHVQLSDGDLIETGPFEFTVRIRPSERGPATRGPAWQRLTADRARLAEADSLGERNAADLLQAIRDIERAPSNAANPSSPTVDVNSRFWNFFATIFVVSRFVSVKGTGRLGCELSEWRCSENKIACFWRACSYHAS